MEILKLEIIKGEKIQNLQSQEEECSLISSNQDLYQDLTHRGNRDQYFEDLLVGLCSLECIGLKV